MKRFGKDEQINLDDEDIEFVVQQVSLITLMISFCHKCCCFFQVWKSRCAVSQKRFGGHIILTLTRWNPDLPPEPYNLVLMMQNEAQKLAEQGQSAFPPEIVNRINKRLAWAKEICDDCYNMNQLVPVVSKNRKVSYSDNDELKKSQPIPWVENISYLLVGLGLGSILSERL